MSKKEDRSERGGDYERKSGYLPILFLKGGGEGSPKTEDWKEKVSGDLRRSRETVVKMEECSFPCIENRLQGSDTDDQGKSEIGLHRTRTGTRGWRGEKGSPQKKHRKIRPYRAQYHLRTTGGR